MVHTLCLGSLKSPSRSASAKPTRRSRRQSRASWKPLLEQLECRAVPSTFTVNTTLDEDDATPMLSAGPDGNLSLREAINAANANPGPDTINFNIPTTDPNYNGQWWTIRLGPTGMDGSGVSLPALVDDGTTIDGFSQPGGASGTVGAGTIPGVADSGNHGVALIFRRPNVAIDANDV